MRRLRKTLLDDIGALAPGDRAEVEGVEVSLVLAEVEPVGGFVGLSVSEPVLQGGIVAGTFGYMLYLNPLMAILALAVFSPQAVFVPLMQRAINRRVVTRTGTLRRISGGIIGRRSIHAVKAPVRAYRPGVPAQHGHLQAEILDELPDEPDAPFRGWR
ncbi:hypothetical protein ACU4GA_16910 [Methylobacterium oryzae CBMB20]